MSMVAKEESELARRLHMKIGELDPVLKKIEYAGKIKLIDISGEIVVGLGED